MNSRPADLQIPVTLRPSRGKTLLLVLGCAVFVGGSILLIHRDPLDGYLGTAFFGLGLLVFAVQLLPNATYLHLATEGFTYCTLFRAFTVPWIWVDHFGILKIHSSRLVAWNYVPTLPTLSRARKLSKETRGFHAALPNSYGLKPQELADLLNALVERYRH